MAFGTVAFWNDTEAWGAITTPDRPGLGFVSFGQIRGVEGYRELIAGQDVEFECAPQGPRTGVERSLSHGDGSNKGAVVAGTEQRARDRLQELASGAEGHPRLAGGIA